MNKNIDSLYLYATGFSILLNVLMTWFMVSFGFELVLTNIQYPASGLSLIVFDPIVPVVFIGWLLIMISNPIGIAASLKEFYPNNKSLTNIIKICGKVITITFIAGLIALLLNFVTWPQIAKSQGYSKCPETTLLEDEAFSSAWVKNINTCSDKRINMIMDKSMHENVLKAQKHLKKL